MMPNEFYRHSVLKYNDKVCFVLLLYRAVAGQLATQKGALT